MTKRQADRLGVEAAARILALQRLGENDAEFARRIGLSPQQVNNYKNEGRGASLEVVRDVAVRTGVSVDHFLGVETEVSAAAARQANAQSKIEQIRNIIESDEGGASASSSPDSPVPVSGGNAARSLSLRGKANQTLAGAPKETPAEKPGAGKKPRRARGSG